MTAAKYGVRTRKRSMPARESILNNSVPSFWIILGASAASALSPLGPISKVLPGDAMTVSSPRVSTNRLPGAVSIPVPASSVCSTTRTLHDASSERTRTSPSIDVTSHAVSSAHADRLVTVKKRLTSSAFKKLFNCAARMMDIHTYINEYF